MNQVVIDASVALKWFLPEPETVYALALRDGQVAGRLRLLAPDSFFTEVANGLRRVADYGLETTSQALAQLANLGLERVPVDDALLAEAIHLAYATRCTVSEALYLALARGRGCPLVTADGELLARLAGTEVTISVVALREWRAQ